MNECVVRSAVFMDFMAVLNIVNAPENQVYSNKQETIELLDHMDWFKKKYFSGERNYCYVIEMEVRTVGSGVVVGFCRYDYADDRYVVSIAIDPSFHGRGLGGRLLRESMGMLPDDGVRLSAEILKGNIGSIRLFERAGFRLDREESDRVFYGFERNRKDG